MALFTMLLQKTTDATTQAVTGGGITVPAGTKFLISDSDNMLLPLMMFSGGFGTGTGGGMMDNPLMLILLMKGL
jgi:hypothetical protein